MKETIVSGPEQNEMWDSYRAPERPGDEGALRVDVNGFEGPLDLLLALARSQKVDITRISILALADQYLVFIEKISGLRLEVAADYLVMAAWLAELAFRLRRLEAMRDAAARLANRNRLGRDVFERGQPEPVAVVRHSTYSATLYDLLSAYAVRRQETAISVVRVKQREVWSLHDAREILTRLIGRIADWTPMEVFLSPYFATPELRTSVRASSFGASLELVREGRLELRQTAPFAPLYIRDRVQVVRSGPEAANA